MKALKLITLLLSAYVVLVIISELFLGFVQPEFQNTLTITTTDENGISNDRVLVRLDSDGQLYVSANHWPRTWYDRVLENPGLQVQLQGREKAPYQAVPVTDEDEHDHVDREHRHGIGFKFLTGFAPRYFIRLEPRRGNSAAAVELLKK